MPSSLCSATGKTVQFVAETEQLGLQALNRYYAILQVDYSDPLGGEAREIPACQSD